MTDVLPLAYGYMRDDLLGERDAAENTLRAAAIALGYELGTVFHEPRCGSQGLPPAFVDLLTECRRADAEAVITPRGHLSETVTRTVLQTVLVARCELIVHEVGS
ncbi:hypothetical protein [Nocardia niwae]|uniref:Resolvase/invertase-type recombinase catalytic domain-containing protein n=1 Tax=Nocardia niwae TaxID=626084 RepID=A0ABV2XCX7_9NOCA|nr:hypothetical protein [Nocardia niwae]